MKLATFSLLAGSTAAFPALLNLSGKGKLLDLRGNGGLLDLGGTLGLGDGDGGLLGLTGKGGILDLSGVTNLSVLDANLQRTKANTWPAADPATCPFNKDHKPAAKWNSKFPYNHAQNGLPGKGKGGFQVPMPGDDDHKFIAPGPNDIRGPCPGMNMLANHGFIARDGITNFVEAVDACQNVFNMHWDLAVVITLIATVLGDGDAITQKFSIGCDATSRTAAVDLNLLTGSQPGLNGHGNFEVDGSMSRNDYFISEGDVFTLNGTLFGQMVETTGGNFTKSGISKVKYNRWHDSQKRNDQFFYGPIGLISYAASAFLPELYGDGESASTETIATFFGVHQDDSGAWIYGHNESIPANWYNRKEPYGLVKVVENLLPMYLENPVLFGGNTADGKFDAIDFGAIKEGKLDAGLSVNGALCLIYQLLAWPIPGPANGILNIGKDAVALITSVLGDTIAELGCSAPLNAS